MKKVKLNPFYTSNYLTKGKVYDVLDEDEENRYMLLDDDGDKVWFRKCKFDVVGDGIDDINSKIGFLKDKVAYLEHNNTELANGVIDCVRKNESLREKNDELNELNEKLRTEMKIMYDDRFYLLSQLSKQSTEISDLKRSLVEAKRYSERI